VGYGTAENATNSVACRFAATQVDHWAACWRSLYPPYPVI